MSPSFSQKSCRSPPFSRRALRRGHFLEALLPIAFNLFGDVDSGIELRHQKLLGVQSSLELLERYAPFLVSLFWFWWGLREEIAADFGGSVPNRDGIGASGFLGFFFWGLLWRQTLTAAAAEIVIVKLHVFKVLDDSTEFSDLEQQCTWKLVKGD